MGDFCARTLRIDNVLLLRCSEFASGGFLVYIGSCSRRLKWSPMSFEFSALAIHDLDLHDVGMTAHVHFDLIKQINLGEKLHQSP